MHIFFFYMECEEVDSVTWNDNMSLFRDHMSSQNTKLNSIEILN